MFSSFIEELNSLLEFIGDKLTDLFQQRLGYFRQANVEMGDSYYINNCARIVSVMVTTEYYGVETLQLAPGEDRDYVVEWGMNGTTAEVTMSVVSDDFAGATLDLYVVYERA